MKKNLALLISLKQQDAWRITKMFYLQLFKDNKKAFFFKDIRANLNPTKPCQADFEDEKSTGRALDRIPVSHC